MVDAAGSIEDRIFKFLLSRGVSPGEALSLAKEELARRAQDTTRNQEFARQNPGSLSSESASDPSLPGSDPTAGPVQGSVERPQASTPLTNAQIDEMRYLRPMVRDDRPGWVQNSLNPPQKPERMPSIAEFQFLKGASGTDEYKQREAAYNALVEAKKAHPRTMEQRYNPTVGSDSPSSEGMVQRALAATSGSAPPSGASAATPTAPSGRQEGASPEMLATPRQDDGRADYDALFSSLGQRQSAGSGRGSPASAPAPVSRPEPAAAPTNTQLLWEKYNRSMQDESSGSAADFVRADQGRASGGSANGRSGGSSGSGRDAALHKALEIIQNLLMHRR